MRLRSIALAAAVAIFSGGIFAAAISGTPAGVLPRTGGVVTGHTAVGAAATIDGPFYFNGTFFTSAQTLNIRDTSTQTAVGLFAATVSEQIANPTALTNAYFNGALISVRVPSGNAQTFNGGVSGSITEAQTAGSGPNALLVGGAFHVFNAGTGAVASQSAIGATSYTSSSSAVALATGASFATSDSGTSTITTEDVVLVKAPTNTGGGTVLNHYGLYIEDQSPVGSTNSYNLYSAGATAKNLFAGPVAMNGGVTINGATVKFAKTFTVVYDPASLAAGAARCDNVTVTGITTTGGAVSANIGAVDPATGCVMASVRASAADTVRVCWQNTIDTITACDTASSTWTFTQAQ